MIMPHVTVFVQKFHCQYLKVKAAFFFSFFFFTFPNQCLYNTSLGVPFLMSIIGIFKHDAGAIMINFYLFIYFLYLC